MENIHKNRFALLAEALKSGQYKEANPNRNTLRCNDGFSINGVACEIYRSITNNGKWNGNNFQDDTENLGSFISCGCSYFLWAIEIELL